MIPLLLLLLALTGTAGASTLTYTYTLTGTLVDGPVSASADLTLDTTAHTLDIVLSNLLANPVSDGQTVSELFVGGLLGSPVLASSYADQVTAPASSASPRPGGSGWGFGAVPGGYDLCIICPGSIHPPGKTAPPSLLIIGPPDGNGQYSNANSSILAHNPYLFEQATFHLTGITNTPVDNGVPFTGVKVGFGSQAVELSAGDPVVHGLVTSPVPEPGAWMLAAGGLLLVYIGKKRFGITG